jgi:hypothetical protein
MTMPFIAIISVVKVRVLYMQNNNLYIGNNDYYENILNCKCTYTIEEVEAFIVVKQ